MNFSLKSITSNLGYQQITPMTSAVTLTLPTVIPGGNGLSAKPRLAIIQCTGQNVRWTDDGTTPTSTLGMVLVVGDTLAYDGDMQKLKFIEAASAAVLNVSYYA